MKVKKTVLVLLLVLVGYGIANAQNAATSDTSNAQQNDVFGYLMNAFRQVMNDTTGLSDAMGLTRKPHQQILTNDEDAAAIYGGMTMHRLDWIPWVKGPMANEDYQGAIDYFEQYAKSQKSCRRP